MDSVQEIMEKIVAKVRDVDVMSDLDATVKYAGENGGDTEHIGITGFCWGGRIVWLYAAHTNPNATPKTALKAGVAWYGMLENSPFGQTQAIDVAAKIKVPVLGLYGAQDDSIPVKTIQDMRIALHNNSKDDLCQIRIYPEAGHGFFADYRPSYNTFAAQDGWGRTLAWFKKLMF
jgi:carboxymethylenebutenolidase